MSLPPRFCPICLKSIRRCTPVASRVACLQHLRASSNDAVRRRPPESGSDDSPSLNATARPPSSNAANTNKPEPGQGSMSRRLEEATEEALLTGGRAGRRAIEDAGFSEELKARLLDKIADAKLHSDTASTAGLSSGVSSLPASAGLGTRHIAASQAWAGEEPMADAVLRMLDDARKPLAPGLRGKPTIPRPGGGGATQGQPGAVVDMRLRREPAISAGQRAANARERATAYAGVDTKGLSADERAAVKAEFRARFEPHARGVMPSTISGLAELANKRIEDAIARGQFRNIPRGPGVESRDARADNPFIDTTEYIMNKMIKRQDMVPPWIEKQQELAKAARVFRARLRNEWRRHAARSVAAGGGSLEEQMRRARAYARAEEAWNPRRRDVDQIAVPANTTDDPVMVARMRQQQQQEQQEVLDGTATGCTSSDSSSPPGAVAAAANMVEEGTPVVAASPFRDPTWEAAEQAYMELAVRNLNALARSYNLMAPDLAKKPYFSLARELDACFADVAPELADAIRERATAPRKGPRMSLLSGGGSGVGVLDRFGRGGGRVVASARVYDSKTPNYGFKEMWKDLWGSSAKGA